jgi:hypothetical protein
MLAEPIAPEARKILKADLKYGFEGKGKILDFRKNLPILAVEIVPGAPGNPPLNPTVWFGIENR